MRTALLIVFLAMVVCVSGCVFVVNSLQPFYTERDVILEPALIGSWEQQPEKGEQAAEKSPVIWAFKKSEEAAENDAASYELKMSQGDRWATFSVHLAKLGEDRFLDLYPEDICPQALGEKPGDTTTDGDGSEGGFVLLSFFLHFAPTHTVSRIHLLGDELKIAQLNADWLAEKAGEKPPSLPHVDREGALTLTASPEQLRAFLLKHASEDRAFKAPVVLKRQKPGASGRPKGRESTK
jgi:hypothetical protein